MRLVIQGGHKQIIKNVLQPGDIWARFILNSEVCDPKRLQPDPDPDGSCDARCRPRSVLIEVWPRSIIFSANQQLLVGQIG